MDRIVIESGGEKVVLQRSDEGWNAAEANRTFTDRQVNKLIETFNKTHIVSFRASTPPGEAGLEPPAQRLAFYAWLSENTAEEAAGGHAIASVDLGDSEANGDIFARGGAEGEIVTIPSTLTNALIELLNPAPSGGNAPPENQSNADSR